jgi:hypothetical protein
LLGAGLFYVGVVALLFAFSNTAEGRKSTGGAIVAIAAWTLLVALGIALATWHYRRTMRRRWPNVRPGEDDDW